MATPFDAIGNFLGGIIDNFWTDERQKNQNDWNMQMWEKNAQWNSPENQMKLMQQAGINPAFAAAGISGNPGYQAPVGSQVMPQSMGFNNFGTNMAKAFESRSQGTKNETETDWLGRLNQSQIDKAYAEILKDESLAHLNDEQKKVIREQLELFKGKTAKEIEKMTAEIDQIKTACLQIQALTSKTESEKKNIEQDTKNKQALNEQIQASTENIQQDTQLKKQEEKTSASLADLNLQQVQKIASEIGLINVQKELAELNKAKTEADTQVSKAEYANKIRDAIEKDVEIFYKSRGAGNGIAGDLARLFITHVFNGDQDPAHLDYNIIKDDVLNAMEGAKNIKHPKLVTPTMNDRFN